jgi:hypothetical protein
MLKGQALVVVLLVLGVAVTVGLSIVSRSVTEVSVSTGEEESNKALEAAEAGVERALGGVVAVDGPAGVGSLQEASFNVTNTGVGGGNTYEVPFRLSAGDVATISLEGYTGPAPYNNFQLCWGNGSGAVPAVEVILYFRDASGEMRVGRQAYDPDEARNDSNGFEDDSPGSCAGGLDYDFYRAFDLADVGWTAGGTPIMLRVRVLYNTTPQPIALRVPAGNLPSQGSEIISTGQAGGSTQRLRVIQANPDLPLMFDSALFSGSSLTQ